MFIDERTQCRIHANPGESVSHGTMRTQDLIPAFMDVIRDTPEYVQVMDAVPSHAMEDKEADWWDSEEAVRLLESLFDTLIAYAPEGYCFGSHPGDGSDYGYWESGQEEGQNHVQKIISIAKKDGWSVRVDENREHIVLFEFSKFTPYGQDFNFQAEMRDDNPDTLVKSIWRYYENLDPDKEASLWIGPDGHGKRGAPYHIKDIVSDMEAAEDMVYQLYTAINETF